MRTFTRMLDVAFGFIAIGFVVVLATRGVLAVLAAGLQWLAGKRI